MGGRVNINTSSNLKTKAGHGKAGSSQVSLSDNSRGRVAETQRAGPLHYQEAGGKSGLTWFGGTSTCFDNPFRFLPHTTNFCLIAVLHFVETSSKQYLSVSRQKQ